VGTTFLYVTHDQGEALTMSDTISVMNEGTIVQTGSPDHIYDYPDNLFTADFIGAGNFIPIGSVSKKKGLLDLTAEKGGRFKSYSGPKQGTGSVAPVFFIRPEKIKISKGSEKNANIFSGTIRSSIFEGPDIRLELSSPELGTIRMEIKNDGTPFEFKKSDTLSFYWDRKDGMVLYR
jgi:ABC-type Fe3+/spermidine/putrescine transport system ATPase subunit